MQRPIAWRSWCLRLVLAASGAAAAVGVGAGTLYTCVDARGIVRYSVEPCVQGRPPMAIDRVEHEERSAPSRPPAAPTPAGDAAREGTAPTRTLTPHAWQSIDARYRIPARPSGHPELRAQPPARGLEMQGPLGRPAPGTQGPLVVTPPAPALAPTSRPGPVADPATGHVLAPFGDRLVDPMTGTIWQRSGSLYVDPVTGRVIPAP